MLLETNIDDMNPEFYDVIFDKLYKVEALEVFITPVLMKKNRPANVLSVICKQEYRDIIIETIFRNTSSIGIREKTAPRYKLKRETKILNTAYGNIRVKISYYNNEITNTKFEYDDCKKVSMKHNIPIENVYKMYEEELKKLLSS